jgi:serine/threonine-protein kinase
MPGKTQVLGLLEEMLSSGKTPEEVCQGCPELLPEVRERWQAFCLIDAQVRSLLPGLGVLTAPDRVVLVPAPAGLPQVPGHELEAVLGQGGMGVVYRARQIALGRTVAVKMLPAGPPAGPQELGRFRRETAALACLRHPNIVQVYEAGDVEGRPYFTMELVEGGSLARKLAGAPQPARQAAALAATLAEAVQVAHQAGIVHRDLKPGNILLQRKTQIPNPKSQKDPGRDLAFEIWDFEPKVTDFGLARRLEAETRVTQTGVPVGTPSYMAPEQARGQTAVGPAVDVYALGAILYELLTGRPPFRAETAAATVYQVIHHQPVPPSRLNFKVPRDLETICLKCLQKAPPHRYASARALADDLRRFGEGRPIQARPVGWPVRLWRWGRRKPATAGLLAALLVLFLLTVGGGWWLERQQAERQGRAREAVEAALEQVPSLRRQGRWTEAEAVLKQGRSRLDEAGSDDLGRRLAQAEEDLRLAAALERIRLTPAIEGSRFDYRGMAQAYARAFKQAGLDVLGDGETAAARIRTSDLRPQLVMALDHWAYVADELKHRQSMARLLRVAQRADPDPDWGDRFRDPALWGDPKALRRLAAEAERRLTAKAPEKGPPPPLVGLLAKKLGQQDRQAKGVLLGSKKSGQHDGQAEALLRAAQWRHPEDFWLNYALGEALRERKPAEAVGFYRAALVTRPAVATVYNEISMALLRQGQVDEAIRAARKMTKLIPMLPVAHHQLGVCLQARGQLDEAMAAYRRAIQLNPKWFISHYQLGVCLQDTGQLDEAMAAYRRAIQLDPKGAAAPVGIGMCLQARGQLDGAMAAYRRAIQLDPKGANGATAHYQLGLCLQARDRLDEAVAEYRGGVELDPDWGPGHGALAEALLRCGRIAEARTAVRHGLDVLPNEEPGRPALREKLKLCERIVALDTRLPALLKGKERPAAAELLELARLCRDYGRPHAATDLYTAAFAARPPRADDLGSSNRYAAACAAARAAAAKDPLGGPERAGLRRQALAWLRADLALGTRLLNEGQRVVWSLADWQTDADLASVRDPARLAKLPEAERALWQRLWADVAALRAADPLEQGRAHAARRQWAKAAACYARAIKGGQTDDGHFWFEYAALLLLSGDRPGYKKSCARMVERFGKVPDLRAYHVARACTLAEGAVAEAPLPGRLAAKELQAAAREFWSLTEQGALAYRAGPYEKAVPLFERSLAADPKAGRAVLNWLWLALAQQRLGRSKEARRWLDKATVWLDQYRDGMPDRAEGELGLHLHNWLEAHVLRREAEALLPGQKPGNRTR